MTLPTILQAAARIQAGETTPVDLVDECLDRIDAFENRLHAWVSVDRDEARAAAEKLAAEARKGKLRGPLHGIPLGIKDIVDVAGWPTIAGSPLREDYRAERDAPLVANLRAAGAVILGKTVTTEFACFDPPATRNPWHPEATPGGSSSGSAAATAAGMCYGAVGSQTGGSITRPATYCGIAGLKPTFGLVSVEGVVPVAEHLDHPGPMARAAGDLGVLLSAMTGGAIRFDDTKPDAPLELAVPRGFFLDECDAPMRELFESSVARLREAGARVVDVPLPESFAQVLEMHLCIMQVEAARNHAPWFPAQRDAYGPKIASLLDAGLARSPEEYETALVHQRAFHQDMLRLFDEHAPCLLLTPATPAAAPLDRGTTGDPKFNAPWSYGGLPTLSIPCGLTPAGLPGALQLIAPPRHEPLLLAAGAWTETALPFTATPPLLDDPA